MPDSPPRGYETPPTPKSEISSHESYKKPPQRPCPCNLPFYYNRYPKDRFGIYLPRDQGHNKESVTAPPALVEEEPEPDEPGVSSARSTASTYSRRSTLSKKRAIPKS